MTTRPSCRWHGRCYFDRAMQRDRTEASDHQAPGLLAPAVAARMSLRTAIWSARPPIYRSRIVDDIHSREERP
jgi:hypothetical protein